ncbi:hypothetical protein J437_LFUL013947 [Ladona fulva]|uniref:Uncharacterized protein n=1 Tax=Ladona fulva TaxID=123851 RepID=A0A8K0P5R1_LADFU|nr:hypothetical protein J437_LFUL013947 [Ladona fulva]
MGRLGISWVDRIKNDEVCKRLNEKGNALWKSIVKRRAELVGHILRHESLVKAVLEGMVEGVRYRGRPREEYLAQSKGTEQNRKLADSKPTEQKQSVIITTIMAFEVNY